MLLIGRLTDRLLISRLRETAGSKNAGQMSFQLGGNSNERSKGFAVARAATGKRKSLVCNRRKSFRSRIDRFVFQFRLMGIEVSDSFMVV